MNHCKVVDVSKSAAKKVEMVMSVRLMCTSLLLSKSLAWTRRAQQARSRHQLGVGSRVDQWCYRQRYLCAAAEGNSGI
jgi:hypothetical protein